MGLCRLLHVEIPPLGAYGVRALVSALANLTHVDPEVDHGVFGHLVAVLVALLPVL